MTGDTISATLLNSLRYLAKWLGIAVPVGLLIGTACALFLWALDQVTSLRWQNDWLLYYLPVGGVAVGVLYHHYGKSVEAGNNLLIDQIHRPGGGVPRRMMPLVLVGTLVTHLFGGSAGREGTAVQMGGSFASACARRLKLNESDTQILLMVGIAAGFGGVFGTPFAGAIFAIEVLSIGKLHYRGILPCLIAALAGNAGCLLWGIHHAQYHVRAVGIHWDGLFLGKVVLAAVLFGLASRLFSLSVHTVQRTLRTLIAHPVYRPALGGLLVIGLTLLARTRDYLGLGVSTPDPAGMSILQAVGPGAIAPLAWLWKLGFTAVTLGSGFKGGEVTPLFFIGATLGHSLGDWLNAPVDIFGALGLIAIFAGAANTPLACTTLGVELFGGQHAMAYGLACYVAYLVSGHQGIYHAQQIARPKFLR